MITEGNKNHAWAEAGQGLSFFVSITLLFDFFTCTCITWKIKIKWNSEKAS